MNERLEALASHLSTYTPADWRQAIDVLATSINEVDRDATRIWFAFFPLELHLAAEQADDIKAFEQRYVLMGTWRLADQVDKSHRFLFAHRFWPQVKSAIEAYSGELPGELAGLITLVAEAGARPARVDREVVLGLAAAGLMTLRQAGSEAFERAPGTVHLSPAARAASAHQIFQRRAKDDRQGLRGFLRGLRKEWTITFDENTEAASFKLIHGQEIATAAQADKREYRSAEPRCIPGEGPIPVECRAASCGTCWVGVLGGGEKLSEVVPRDEGKRMRVFGYVDTDDPRPLIRLACQARATGAVSLVIPPWNGIIGKLME